MERQVKLITEEADLYEGVKPEVRVVKNTYMSAGALIREIVIKKTWIVPTKRVILE
jgi:hypothetical protein